MGIAILIIFVAIILAAIYYDKEKKKVELSQTVKKTDIGKKESEDQVEEQNNKVVESKETTIPSSSGSQREHGRWEKIRITINAFGTDEASYKDLIKYINSNFEPVKESTLRTYLIAATVNHATRVHYTPNNKPRMDSHECDLLYQTNSGNVIKYESSNHGKWGIFEGSKGKLKVVKF